MMAWAMEHIRLLDPLSHDKLTQRLQHLVPPGGRFEAIVKENSPMIGVSDGRSPAPETLCFIDRPQADSIQAGRLSVITTAEIASRIHGGNLYVVDDPRALYIDLIDSLSSTPGFHCFSSLTTSAPGIHESAEVHPAALIEAGTHIGEGCVIAAGCVIKRGTHVGRNVIIRENTVIGCDGIALYKSKDGRRLHFPHLAGAYIGAGSQIGAGCVIPRGMLSSTRIGENCVIGNLSNIGHGCRIGNGVWMSAGCLIGGHAQLGVGCTLGIGSTLRDNVTLGRDCSVGMGSVVAKDLAEGSSVFGNPARRLADLKTGPER